MNLESLVKDLELDAVSAAPDDIAVFMVSKG